MTDPKGPPVPSYTTLDYAVADGILTLTLDRPEELNAFTVDVLMRSSVLYRRPE